MQSASAGFLLPLPDWIWPNERIDYMKLMLFFFDGIAMSLSPERFEINSDQASHPCGPPY